MEDKIAPMEKIWDIFENKYLAVYVAALEARRINDLQKKHLYDRSVHPILEAIRRVVAGEVEWEETKK